MKRWSPSQSGNTVLDQQSQCVSRILVNSVLLDSRCSYLAQFWFNGPRLINLVPLARYARLETLLSSIRVKWPLKRNVAESGMNMEVQCSTVTTRICHLLWSCLPHPCEVSAPICHSPSPPRSLLNFRGSPRIFPHIYLSGYMSSLFHSIFLTQGRNISAFIRAQA